MRHSHHHLRHCCPRELFREETPGDAVDVGFVVVVAAGGSSSVGSGSAAAVAAAPHVCPNPGVVDVVIAAVIGYVTLAWRS